MQCNARAAGKYVPTRAELESLAKTLIAKGMKCAPCGTIMQWKGSRSETHTVSLQHDRSGRIRLICRRCNSRHDDFPGDTFYKTPVGFAHCHRCKTTKPLADFYPERAGSCCKPCRKALNKEMWAKYGKQWMKNSQERKREKI
jgi:hypothetical protein